MSADPSPASLLAGAPEPDHARHLAERVIDSLGTPAPSDALRERIAALCARAPFLARDLSRKPEALRALGHDSLVQRMDRAQVAADLEAVLRDGEDPGVALRREKYRQLARITLRDLLPGVSGSDDALTLFELTDLAELLLRAAFATAATQTRERHGEARFGDRAETTAFCILGLGKLGGGELNYSSDVDLIYIHADVDRRAASPSGLHAGEYFGHLARAFGALVESANDEGFLYRVDLELRPEGHSGPLVISESHLCAYYESRADTWERAAFAKARPIAGDLELGWRAIRAVSPVIYRSVMDLSGVESIRRMKIRVAEERGTNEGVFDVKRDPGGIRDVEFFAQALQLLHGDRIPQLRDRSTLGALERLAEVDLIPSQVADALRDAYLWMRRLENRMQMREERQTHTLPTDDTSLRYWARAMCEDEERFAALLATTRQTIREAAERIFPEGRAERVLDLFARHQPAMLANPASRRMMEQLAGAWAREITASSDPEFALINLDHFIGGIGARRFYYELLLDRPELVPRLVAVFASSRFLSSILTTHPRLIEPVFEDPERLLLSKEELRDDLERLLAQIGGDNPDFESELSALRLFHHRQVLNIGLLDLGGSLPHGASAAALSDVAEVCLERALAVAEKEMSERRPDFLGGAEFAVVGMGKLASRELGYGSDLDLIFLYDAGEVPSWQSAEAQNYFVRLTQRLISVLQTQSAEGRCYEIDPRLRPSGGQGSLVSSFAGFERYHDRDAELWERQTLLRSRTVAGSATLCARFERARRAILERALPDDLAAQIHHIRKRMEQELGRESAVHRDFKLGRGGLLDVENAVQYLQLCHGREHPELFEAAPTVEHLERVFALGLLGADDADALRAGLEFLQRLSKSLRVVENRSISDLDTERGDLEGLGRRMGIEPGPRERDTRRAFLALYERHTEAVRRAYRAVLGITET